MSSNAIHLTDQLVLYPISCCAVSEKAQDVYCCFLLVHFADTPFYSVTWEVAEYQKQGDLEAYTVLLFPNSIDRLFEQPISCFNCAAQSVMINAVKAFNEGSNIMVRACRYDENGYSNKVTENDLKLQRKLERYMRKHSGDCLYKAITAHITESANTSTR